MKFARWLRAFAPVVMSLLLLVTACSKAPSRYADVQKETTGRGAQAAVVKAAEQGSTFNKFFPDATGDYEVVPAQEKKGFAEYKLNKDGKNVAMLSVSDTANLPAAALKYQTATESIAGYPSVNQGTMSTGLLVNSRYQVKVLSRDPSFSQEDRVAWLQKFDLRGLAKLEGAEKLTNLPTTATQKAKAVVKQSTDDVKADIKDLQAPAVPQLPGLKQLKDSFKDSDNLPPVLIPQPAA
ncbi:hypothetical protein [Rivularia sp. UHCC 0363]|uniref:hypothetical protein n=1 Tax=Rivularia sp. UHCC 0363 TaxID=3110244 RepID=UPI002B1F0F4E|nr:hypothetical protein [Rivularia sp. UHCC 0363]MEA5597450.1 hypothetical protein [Rivularia sp. UHCC 0363]